MKRLGASADWTRSKFTLDPQMCYSVNHAFVQLHAKGLIHRGDYLVNWSPGLQVRLNVFNNFLYRYYTHITDLYSLHYEHITLQTSVSDLEVEYVEEEGFLYTFKYPIFAAEDARPGSGIASSSSCEYIPVSTTRPETILGDTAVCVHPLDTRYKHLIGKQAVVPGTNGRCE